MEIRDAPQPLQQAVLRRPRVEQRRDGRLSQAVVSRHRFRVAPGLEIMMIRTHRVNPGGRFVEPIRKRDAEGDAFEPFEERRGVGIVVGRIDAVDKQGVDLAPLHVRDELRHLGVISLSLQGGPADVDRAPDVPQEMVQARDNRLNRRVLDAADNQRLALMSSKFACQVVHDRGVHWKLTIVDVGETLGANAIEQRQATRPTSEGRMA